MAQGSHSGGRVVGRSPFPAAALTPSHFAREEKHPDNHFSGQRVGISTRTFEKDRRPPSLSLPRPYFCFTHTVRKEKG